MTLTTTGLTLADLFPPDDLAAAIAAKHVERRQHPTLPVSIYTYTRECQLRHLWTPVTIQCRGLIVDDGTGEIVALPFPKIFVSAMHGVHDFAPPLPADEPFEIFEKADGSLIILFHHDGRWHAASKGSFISDQAQWAQHRIDNADLSHLDPALTYLAEAIYPGNRIVVDYRDREDLVLLAAYRPADGTEELLSAVAPHWAGIGPVACSWGLSSDLAELEQLALASKTIDGDPAAGTEEEGYVIRFASGVRAKIKLASYLALHRLMTGTSPRDIWRALGVQRFPDETVKRVAYILACSIGEIEALRAAPSGPLNALLENVPDEFDTWVHQIIDRIEADFRDQCDQAQAAFESLASLRHDRGAFGRAAQSITDPTRRACAFLLLDGRPIDTTIWKNTKPDATAPFVTDEDN